VRREALAAGAALVAVLACCVEPAPREPATARTFDDGPTQGPGAAPEGSTSTDAGAARTGRHRALYVTGSDEGYLDACGCDDGLLGGLPRRRTLLRILSADDEETRVLSNGGLVTGTSPIDRMKVEMIVQAMAQMRYAAIAVTDRELALGREALASLAMQLGDGGVLLGTNLVDRAADGAAGMPTTEVPDLPLPTEALLVRQVNGAPIAIASAIAPSRAALCRAADPLVELADPARALQAALDRAPGVADIVVLAQMDDAEATRLAQALPEIDWIVIPGDPHEDFPREEPLVVGETLIVTTGRKGKFLCSLRFPAAGELPEFERHPIVDKPELLKDPSIVEMLLNYREWLAIEQPIRGYLEQRAPPNGAEYVGSEEGSCASCHPNAWNGWAASKHARAWQTLIDQDLPPDPSDRKGKQPHAIWDPDCVRCHVTGFGFVGGYAGMEREAERPDARLIDVGCEACHGPAGDHAERAAQGDPRWPGGPAPKVATGAAEALCIECHDPDNSPKFELKSYWERISHGREGD
jgi:hypothetical protein